MGLVFHGDRYASGFGDPHFADIRNCWFRLGHDKDPEGHRTSGCAEGYDDPDNPQRGVSQEPVLER